MNELMQNLNSEQLKAVLHKEGPLLIVAGAGTGKTTVITQKIAYMIEQGWAKSDEILALTFTEKAAGEMEERVDRLLPIGYLDLWISTFHSFAERILKSHGIEIGLPSEFKLLNEFEQWILIQKNLDRFNLNYYRPLGNPTKFIQAMVKHFSRLKDEDIPPEIYLKYAEDLKQNLDGMLSGGKGKKKKTVIPAEAGIQKKRLDAVKILDPRLRGDDKRGYGNDKSSKFQVSSYETQEIAQQEVARINEIANAYHIYQQLLLEASALDFGDLINYTLKLFRERPAVLKKYREQFKYILVDEFQDTNWAQYELVKLLVGNMSNLVVVGDDDQCLPGQSSILTKTGKKRIDKIKAGDEVASAVGKGYLSYSRVAFVNKTIKTAKIVSFETKSGRKLEVTDNHKLFCFTPASMYEHNKAANEKFYYVYLMNKQELGWRLGITNDLAVRLKLERSADRIVAVKSFGTEAEARYYEVYLSLKYGIPTAVFQDRGGIMGGRLAEKLYQDLDVESSVRKLSFDLGIDLDAHQVCLDAVNRGGKLRIKIILEMCYRNYRSKHAKGNFLRSPFVSHVLTVETSHRPTVKKIKKLGLKFTPAKNGFRFRVSSIDLSYLGKLANKIQKVTGGIIENRIRAGKTKLQNRKALVVPASNVFCGMYLPVVTNEGIIYDQIIFRKERVKSLAVYDLEVEKTHNFIANEIVVHNSIYRFRGASMSNILQFRKDYATAKQIILTKNYRSKQNILDLAYEFIKLNNPNRLEWRLQSEKLKVKSEKLNKKLIAQNKGKGEIEVLQAEDLAGEVRAVVEKIIELKKADGESGWDNFAILVRANDSAKEFCLALDQAGLPYQFLASRGLYAKPVIVDAVAYFKLLDNYHESPALYRVLNLPMFNFSHNELVNLNYWAQRKSWSLYETLRNLRVLGPGEETIKKAEQVLALIGKHTAMVRDKTAGQTFIAFLNDSGYLKFLSQGDEQKSRENFSYLNQFMKRIQAFESGSDDQSVKAFLKELNLEIDSGEAGSLAPDAEAGPETIKVMTAHGAKGLEFKYVFVANLVDRRFPTDERKEQIEIPDALVKEILPEGDTHLEEERRLFYVAMTRARQGLYFSWAPDYGGARKKKPSRFLLECGLVESADRGENKEKERASGNLVRGLAPHQEMKFKVRDFVMPTYFSYTQLAAFGSCPYQYRFAHILRVPVRGKGAFSFGKTMHATLQKLYELLAERRGRGQGSLFGESPSPALSGGRDNPKVELEEIYKLYDECWIDDWYDSKKDKESYRKKGREILKVYHEKYKGSWPKTMFMEKGFSMKVKNGNILYTVRGVIDRIDSVGGHLKLVDYKTGQPKEKLAFEDKEQLLIYQLAAGELFREEVGALAFYYLDNNSEQEFLGDQAELEKIKDKIAGTIEEIKAGVFPPKPSKLCRWCDFFDICEYRQN